MYHLIMKNSVLEPPKVSAAMMKKYGNKPAIAWRGKIIHIGNFSSGGQYEKIVARLKKKYPKAKEEEFVHTFIPGKGIYILSCKSPSHITKAVQV